MTAVLLGFALVGQGMDALARLYPLTGVAPEVHEFDGPGSLRRYTFSCTYSVSSHPAAQAQRSVAVDQGPIERVTYTEQLASFPERDPVPQIEWQPAKTQSQASVIDLGFGLGRHWLSNGSLPFALNASVVLGLHGGTTADELAAKGLTTHDDINATIDRTRELLSTPPFHDLVVRNLRRNDPSSFPAFVTELWSARDPESDQILVDAYWSKDEKVRSAAEAVLIQRPFRSEARAVYVDLVSRDVTPDVACDAVATLDAREALPAVTQLWKETNDLVTADAAYRAMRGLSRHPLPIAVVAAVDRAIAGSATPHDRRLMAKEPDFVALLALKRTRVPGKGRVGPAQKKALAFFRTLSPFLQSRYVVRFNLKPWMERIDRAP